MSKRKALYIYSGIILSITLIWTFGLKPPYANYGPVFYMLTGFPVNFILLQINFRKFSSLLGKHHPEIYAKNRTAYRDQLRDSFIFQESKLIETLRPIEIQKLHQLTLINFRLVLFNFFMIIPIAIGLIFWIK